MEYFIENKTTLQLFPSLVFQGKINDDSLCDRLEEYLLSLWKNKEGIFAEEEGFTSHDNLNDKPELKELSDIVLKESNFILNFFKVKRDSHFITSMWANISRGRNMHLKHIHPNSFLSGVFYVKTPKDCGQLVITDPRPGSEVIQPDYHERDVYNCGKYHIIPEKGNIHFWQSWLPHCVEKAYSKSEENRICIAFNIMIKGKAVNPTQRYDFN